MMKGLTRVTPLGVEEVMESKPYGMEVSLIMVVYIVIAPPDVVFGSLFPQKT